MQINRWKVYQLALLMLVAAPFAVAGDHEGLEGHWEGAIELPGQTLQVELDFTRDGDGFTGDISIPAQGAKDIPLLEISLDGDAASFQIQGVPGEPTFSGTLSDDGKSIAGDFTQAGQNFPFKLTSGVDRVAKAMAALADIDPIVNAALADWKTPGLGLSIVVDGQMIVSVGYGKRDIESGMDAGSQTLFAIGSSTKAFTATVLGTLVDEGKLDWDEPVAGYLPGFKLYDEYATAHLTLRDMLTHRSGLPRHDLAWYNNESVSRAELVRRMQYLEPNKELRETWQYNNFMFATAGYLIEQVAEMNWEQAVHARILEPLGMTRTNVSVADSEEDANAALPYIEDDDELRKVDFRPIGVMGPAGSINSCPDDMAMWMALNLGGGRLGQTQILSAGTLRELHSPQMVIPGLPDKPERSPMSYGMGWFIETYRGHYRVQHGGNIDGFSALVTLFPNDGVGITVMANKGGSPLPELLTLTLADRLLGLDARDWIGQAAAERDAAKEFAKKGEENKGMFRVEGTKPSRKLSEFVGEYEHPGYGVAEIREDGKRLVFHYNDMTMPLEHWHYDVFNVAERDDAVVPEDLRVSFLSDDRGRASRMTAALEPTVEPIVFRRLPDRKLSDPEYLSRLAGEYELPNMVLTFQVQGQRLVVMAEGQPALALAPSGSDEFDLELVKGYSVKFTVPEEGPATEAIFIQPNGVFPATRK